MADPKLLQAELRPTRGSVRLLGRPDVPQPGLGKHRSASRESAQSLLPSACSPTHRIRQATLLATWHKSTRARARARLGRGLAAREDVVAPTSVHRVALGELVLRNDRFAAGALHLRGAHPPNGSTQGCESLRTIGEVVRE